jgi:hypothetical protein
MVTGDYQSSLFAQLEAVDGVDLILLDLVDERLGVYVLPDGSVVTRSQELVASGSEHHLPDGTRHVEFGSDQHFEYWRDAATAVASFVRQAKPQTQVALLAPPWASMTDAGRTAPTSFGLDATRANAAYPRYIEHAQREFHAHLASVDETMVLAGSEHRWGPAPFHFTEAVYRSLVAQIAPLCSREDRPPHSKVHGQGGSDVPVTVLHSHADQPSMRAPASDPDAQPQAPHDEREIALASLKRSGPNFLIAGVQRGGAAWLAKQLHRHPDVHVAPSAASNFLSQPSRLASASEVQRYVELVRGPDGCRWRGESSTQYFWHSDGGPFGRSRSDTAATVAELLGKIPVLLTLRNPVMRAISAYWHQVSAGRVDATTGIFRADPALGIIDLGFYKRHYEHWAGAIGRENLHILLFDDLVESPHSYLSGAFNALGLDAPEVLLEEAKTAGPVNRQAWLDPIKRRHPVGQQEVAALANLYRHDIDFIQELTGRELGHWHESNA